MGTRPELIKLSELTKIFGKKNCDIVYAIHWYNLDQRKISHRKFNSKI